MPPTRLVLLAHGSPDPRSGEGARAIAAAVRAELPGIEVQLGFLEHDEPAALDVLTSSETTAVLVPLLLSDAFHGKVDVPRVLQDASRLRPGLQVCPAPVLGDDVRLLGDTLLRLREAAAPLEDARAVIVLAAAGSTDQAALGQLRVRAERLAVVVGRPVRMAYASSAQPDVGAAVATEVAVGARVCLAPYVLSPGVLADRIERAGRDNGAEVIGAPLGAAPGVVVAVVDGYRANR